MCTKQHALHTYACLLSRTQPMTIQMHRLPRSIFLLFTLYNFTFICSNYFELTTPLTFYFLLRKYLLLSMSTLYIRFTHRFLFVFPVNASSFSCVPLRLTCTLCTRQKFIVHSYTFFLSFVFIEPSTV